MLERSRDILKKSNQTNSTIYFALNMKLYNVLNRHVKIILNKVNFKNNLIPRKL